MSLAFLLVLGLLGIGLMLDGRRRARRDAAEPDRAILSELARAGSDTGQPHDLEFYLVFPTELAAEGVAAALRTEGFVVLVSPEEGGREWLCLATRQMRPDLRELRQWRVRLGAVAAAAGGEYDGWGATVVEVADGTSPAGEAGWRRP